MTTPVDGHVHLHAEFGTDSALTAAVTRFAGACGEPCGVLCLTESAGVDAFAGLRSRVGGAPNGEWTVHATEEDESVRCERRSGGTVFVLAGRQVVAAEDLEVLAVATPARFEDGAPFLDAVRAVVEDGAIAVVPWGFGKWWGRRGRLVREAFAGAAPDRLFPGDNGGRWHPAGPPPLLRELRAGGYRVLPGSDPLPLPDQDRRVGSAGFVLQDRPDSLRPAAWLRSRLRDPQARVEGYGDGVGLAEFVLSQARMQLRKRGRAAA